MNIICVTAILVIEVGIGVFTSMNLSHLLYTAPARRLELSEGVDCFILHTSPATFSYKVRVYALQEYPQYLLLAAVALELIGGVLFVLDFAVGAIFLVGKPRRANARLS